MTDTPDSSAAVAPTFLPHGMSVARSPYYRTFFSNFFRTRVGAGDFSLLFGSISDTPGAVAANLLMEEASVIMTWPQLKSLVGFLTNIVNAIEEEAGPIQTGAVLEKEAIRQSVLQSLRGAQFGKRP
jgi:hypothetical protein